MGVSTTGLEQKLALLSSFSSLTNLDDPVWLETVAAAEVIVVPQDRVVLCKGDPCQNFMLIAEGSLRVHEVSASGREIVLYRVKPGDICVLALTSMVDGVPYGAEVITETPVTGLSLSQDQFQAALAGSPGFRNFVLSTLARRLHEVMSLVEKIAFKHLDSRLACTLQQLFGQSDDGKLTVTHLQLANELGTSREVMSRLLKEFEQKRGCIKLHRGAIELTSAETLAEFARRDLV
ncbi:MAG: Crp/Fnr family transcriptional regulator [Acidiferrobacterales bacterium]